MQYGHFAYTGRAEQPITHFIQSEVSSVVFVQDGSNNKPQYTLTVSDGLSTSEPSQGDVTFSDPSLGISHQRSVWDSPEFKFGFAIGSVAFSTLVGAAWWKYRLHKEAELRREKLPLANLIRTILNLSDVKDFESGRGVGFYNAINLLIGKLKDNHQIEVHGMTQTDLEDFAIKVSNALEPYITNRPALAGGTLAWYQTCQNNVWLKTDDVKTNLDKIALEINNRYQVNDTIETDMEDGGIVMQSMQSHANNDNDKNKGTLNASLLKYQK